MKQAHAEEVRTCYDRLSPYARRESSPVLGDLPRDFLNINAVVFTPIWKCQNVKMSERCRLEDFWFSSGNRSQSANIPPPYARHVLYFLFVGRFEFFAKGSTGRIRAAPKRYVLGRSLAWRLQVALLWPCAQHEAKVADLVKRFEELSTSVASIKTKYSDEVCAVRGRTPRTSSDDHNTVAGPHLRRRSRSAQSSRHASKR